MSAFTPAPPGVPSAPYATTRTPFIRGSIAPFSGSGWQTTDVPGALAGTFLVEKNPQAGDSANLALIDD